MTTSTKTTGEKPLPDKDGWVLAADSVTTSEEVHDPQVVDDKKFRITDIPDVMRNIEDWPKSAELMELWFSLPAKEMTDKEKRGNIKANLYPPEYTNTTMFTWDWLEQFSQVPEAQEELLNTLVTKNSKDALRDHIFEHLALTASEEKKVNVSNALDPVQLHSNWQFQFSNVGYSSGTMDDLYGSLGNFALYAAVTKATIAKTTTRNQTSNSYSVHITEVGVYMRDTYEFNGEQYLGHWGFNGLRLNYLGGALNSFDIEYNVPIISYGTREYFDAIGNADYKQYRKRTGLGGDLLLFSDVKTIPVNLKFNVQAP